MKQRRPMPVVASAPPSVPTAASPVARAGGEGPALRVEHLAKDFGGTPVLNDLTLQVRSGEVVALMGRSGSGKSTLIHLLAGLDSPTRGSITIRGVDMAHLDPNERAAFRLAHVGIVFQHFNLLPDLTVLENVALPLKLAGRPRAKRSDRARELLKMFGLTEHESRFPDRLSGGELQRVAVARALSQNPEVLLADEPTASLDEENAAAVGVALRTAARAGAAVVVACHDAVLSERADRKFQLVRGSLLAKA